MKVLFVLGSFPELSETFIVNQIVSLIELGVEVDILSYDKGKSKLAYSALVTDYRLIEKCVYIENDRSLPRRLISFVNFMVKNYKSITRDHFSNIRLLYQYQDVLLNQDYDIIHSHFGTVGNRFSQDFQKTPFFMTTKRLCTFHGWDVLPTKIEKLKIEYYQLLQYFNAFTYNTPYLGDIILNLNINLKTYELPVGIHIDFLNHKLNKGAQEDTKFKILFCGRLVKWKGCLQVLDIAILFTKTQNENWEINIIGDGPEFKNMSQIIIDNELHNKVFLLGKQPQDVVFDMMNNADVFLLPGIYDEKTDRAETQGLVIQEAQFFYLPVIISNAGGSKYGMTDKETGYIVDHKNINGYVEKLIDLMNDREKVKKMGESGHDYVIENFSTKILAQRLLLIYKDMLSK